MAKMGRAPQRHVAVGDVPLLLLISIVLFCKPLVHGTSLIRFSVSQTTHSLISVFPLWVPVMEVGHAMAYDGYAEGASGMTDLQKHVSFFDSNGDGIISINETYKGELLVCSPFQSFVHPLRSVCCNFSLQSLGHVWALWQGSVSLVSELQCPPPVLLSSMAPLQVRPDLYDL
jgi:hypothetical protein